MNERNNCLFNVLNVINVLQNNAEKIECIDNTCTRPFLGMNTPTLCFNTRPITLYRCDNSLVSLNYTVDGTIASTTVFRVSDICNDSVTVLLLIDNGDGTYTSTNTFATIGLKCICAIRCLPDVVVENI